MYKLFGLSASEYSTFKEFSPLSTSLKSRLSFGLLTPDCLVIIGIYTTCSKTEFAEMIPSVITKGGLTALPPSTSGIGRVVCGKSRSSLGR